MAQSRWSRSTMATPSRTPAWRMCCPGSASGGWWSSARRPTPASARPSTAPSPEAMTRRWSATHTPPRTRPSGGRPRRIRLSRTRTCTGPTRRRLGGRPGRSRPKTSISPARPNAYRGRKASGTLVSDGVAVLVCCTGGPCCPVLQAFGQPAVHVADVVFCECHVPVVVEQPGFYPRDVGGEPLAVPEGNVLVLPAVQEQHGDGDVGQFEPPRADVSKSVVVPSLAARREPVMNGICEPCGHLALQDGRIDRRRQGCEPLGHLAGRRGQEPFPVLVYIGARRLRVGEQQPVTVDVVLGHAREPVKPVGLVGRG